MLRFVCACGELQVKSQTMKEAREVKLTALAKEREAALLASVEKSDRSKMGEVERYISELEGEQEGSVRYRELADEAVVKLDLETLYEVVMDQDDRTVVKRKRKHNESSSKSSRISHES